MSQHDTIVSMSSAPPSPRHDRTAAAILDAAAHVLADQGAAASMADVAAAAGVGRATLYRYYATREALLDALAAQALADAGSRLAAAGLEHVPAAEAVERIVRALVSVGERYAVLVQEHVEPDRAETTRLLGDPIRAVFARGIDSAAIRPDLPQEILLELFGGLITTAMRLVRQGRLRIEDAASMATALFLDGARPR